MSVRKQKAKARRKKKGAKKQKAKTKRQREMAGLEKEVAKEEEIEPSVAESQAKGIKPGELIGTTSG